MEKIVKRLFWIEKIRKSWRKCSVIWLCGVRRVGKTFLCLSIPEIEYFDCELPRIRAIFDDPESFLKSMKGKRVVIDEIHRLKNPSEILKIAHDHYSDVKIIATGSSSLGASSKFKDTLTGRKIELLLVPMISDDLKDFGKKDISFRFIRGGLPQFFLSKYFPEQEFQNWMDSYWAKDVQELFHLERHYSFQKFMELLFTHSGGIFEATRFSSPCEVSRGTINNYLKVLEATFIVHIIKPFSSYKSTEIISAPKVYVFDTGFVCYFRGWDKLRNEDMGLLWEHFVLNEVIANLQRRKIFYWRDKRGHEIDFILLKRNGIPTVVECKWSSKNFAPVNILSFRRHYPKGENFVVANDVDRSFFRRYNNTIIKFVSLSEFAKSL